MSKSGSQRANDTYWTQPRGKRAVLTFLYHSLQDIHVVFLRHSAERRELRLGNELQELEQREKKKLLWRLTQLRTLTFFTFIAHSGRPSGSARTSSRVWVHSEKPHFPTKCGSKVTLNSLFFFILSTKLNCFKCCILQQSFYPKKCQLAGVVKFCESCLQNCRCWSAVSEKTQSVAIANQISSLAGLTRICES